MLSDRRVAWTARIAAILILPFFVHLGGRSLGLGQPEPSWMREPGVTLSVPAVMAPLLVAAAMRVGGLKLYRADLRDRAVMALAFVSTIALLVGILVVQPSSMVVSAAFLLQSLLPLAAFVLGKAIGESVDRDRLLPRLFKNMALVVGVPAVGLIVATLWSGYNPTTGFVDHIGPWYVSKAYRFFPTVLATTQLFVISGLLHGQLSRRWLLVLGPSVALIVLSHSRLSLLIILGGSACLVGRMLIAGRLGFRILAVLCLGLSALIAVTALIPLNAVLPGSTGVSRLVSPDPSSSSRYNTARWSAITQSLTGGIAQPLGEMYIADEQFSTAGEEVSVARVAVSENQFGEYGLRAGPAAMLSFALALAIAVSRVLRQPVTNPWVQEALVASILFAGVVGSLVQLNFTEIYAAPLFWLLIGCGGRRPRHRSTPASNRMAQRVPVGAATAVARLV